jgi:TctA family transporter
VLGPGAANNSTEGGSLIPTIAFGVPGSTAMAILLGGFFLLGLVPGPDMLTKHLSVTFSMVWTIVIANVVTVLACFLLLNQLARLTTVRGTLLIPASWCWYIGAIPPTTTAAISWSRWFGAVGFSWCWGLAARAFSRPVLARRGETISTSRSRAEAAWLTRPVVRSLPPSPWP